ncbi:P-loop containing nucleoside triphosphate hydrolase protein [Hypoxylon sp. FL0890]|nr:P-loop containing nucleoside triphosphate hydrolase protein [Hypoxylon sp. FL0890]
MAPPHSFVTPSHETIPEEEEEEMETSEHQVPFTKDEHDEHQVTFTKDFSFVVPNAFRRSNTVVRWIDGVPTVVEQDESSEGPSLQAPQRAMVRKHLHQFNSASSGFADLLISSTLQNAGEDNNEHDEDDQEDDEVDDQTNENSTLALLEGTGKKAESGRSFKSRISAAYKRLTTTRSDREAMKRFSIDFSPSGPTASASDPSREKMRFIFVGDTGCGKSNLLLRFYLGTFNPDHVKTQYEMFNKTIEVDNKEVDLELWDTSGDIALNQLGLLSYLEWDTVFLCYGMDDINLFKATQSMWVDQIRKYCRDAPVYLVGLKKDTRSGTGLSAPLRPDIRARLCSIENEYGDILMRAIKYSECSAKTGDGVDRVFQEAVRTVLADRGHDQEVAEIHKAFVEQEPKSHSKLNCFK